MPTAGTRVAVCTPVRTHVYFQAPFCALKACTLLRDAGFEQQYFYLPGSALLEHTRSLMAHDALEWGAEVLLWFDDDITFEPEEAVKLVRTAIATQSLVAGVCALRDGKHINVQFKDPKRNYRFFKGGGLEEVNHAGLGMTAIHRSVYERVSQHMPRNIVIADKVRIPYYRTQFWDNLWRGEDYSFSRLMQQYGVSAYADTSIRAVHHGDFGFRIEDVVRGMAPQMETVEVKAPE